MLQIEFVDGRLDKAAIQKSSGVDTLDMAALDMVRTLKAPPLTGALANHRFKIVVPVEYRLQ